MSRFVSLFNTLFVSFYSQGKGLSLLTMGVTEELLYLNKVLFQLTILLCRIDTLCESWKVNLY